MCHQVSPPAPFLAVLYRIAQPVNMAWKCFECCFISVASNADPISEHNRSKHIHSPVNQQSCSQIKCDRWSVIGGMQMRRGIAGSHSYIMELSILLTLMSAFVSSYRELQITCYAFPNAASASVAASLFTQACCVLIPTLIHRPSVCPLLSIVRSSVCFCFVFFFCVVQTLKELSCAMRFPCLLACSSPILPSPDQPIFYRQT